MAGETHPTLEYGKLSEACVARRPHKIRHSVSHLLKLPNTLLTLLLMDTAQQAMLNALSRSVALSEGRNRSELRTPTVWVLPGLDRSQVRGFLLNIIVHCTLIRITEDLMDLALFASLSGSNKVIFGFLNGPAACMLLSESFFVESLQSVFWNEPCRDRTGS